MAISILLILTLVLFIWGKWRYDVVALLSLMIATWMGEVSPSQAFNGFGHPAVITVVFVLIIGKGLVNSGLVYRLGLLLSKLGDHPLLQMVGFTTLIAIVSGFMNNVGALAILMPVALQISKQWKISPSLLLMPLAFGSLLGGMTTLIGTPPNILIANYRETVYGAPYSMFDFFPVGCSIAVSGILFITLIGWRLIPIRKKEATPEEMFEIDAYITEIRVNEDSQADGMHLGELEDLVEGEISVLGLVRKGKKMKSVYRNEKLKPGDILIVEADSDALQALIHDSGATLVQEGKNLGLEELVMTEAVIPPNAAAQGKVASQLRLRKRFGVNLLAVARRGQRLKTRLAKISLRAGDVLLLQGASEDISEGLSCLGCLPLADRGVRLGPRRLALAIGLLVASVTIAAMGIMPIQTTFATAAIVMVLTKLISLRELYDSIDWPVITLLGAMIPLGQAFEQSDAPEQVASAILALCQGAPPLVALGTILVGTMFLSDIINNAAAAILMAPIAVRVATGLGAAIDPFLMSVCIGASCAFLTPIGHQCNALVMGAGGYRFGDYWRLGLPLEILIIALALPLLSYFWPL